MTAAPTLDALRARIEALERHAPEGGLRPSAHAQRRRAEAKEAAAGWGRALTLGCPQVDERFSSHGLPFGAHEIAGEPGEPAASILFATLLVLRRLRTDPQAQALVVQEPCALREGGGLYAPGLWALGLDPGRIIFMTAPEGGEALRITDEAVRSGAVAAVLTEAPRAARRLDLAATQRLNLYGRETGTLALLLAHDLNATSAAMTRWRVRSAPSRAPNAYVGAPVLELELVRNRLGPPGRFLLQWDSDDESFSPAAPLCAPVAAAPGDRPLAPGTPRPDRAAGGGRPPQDRAAAVGGR